MIKSFKKDLLRVNIYKTRAEAGADAARDIEKAVGEVIAEKGECNMIFAAAPSQNDVLAALVKSEKIEWNKVNAFHMDEYIGLSADAPQGFANFLRNALFDRAPFKTVNCLNSAASAGIEIERYAKLLAENPADIAVMGIGENGHIAFNDPHTALFDDKAVVKEVTLDDVCRMQQVHDGCFDTINDVPKSALTLTIPALTAAARAFCIVPAATKANAVKATIEGEITERCPATVLRRHKNAVLYLDSDSAAELF